MSRSNLKLNVSFEFELQAPDALLHQDHAELCRTLNELLGNMVLQGMPTVTGKQLARAGISIASHHHHVDVINAAAAHVPREALIAVAPHLTDAELGELAHRVHGKLPPAPADQGRFIRRHALALVSDFRMVPCSVAATLTSGQPAQLAAKLNLTNGCVLVDERDRGKRLQANQGPLEVSVGEPAVALSALCAGHTLSGPVIEVAVDQLGAHRDQLVALWQAAQA